MKNKISIVSFFVFLFLLTFIIYIHISNREVNKPEWKLKTEYIKNNSIIAKIIKTDSYYEGKHGYSYYVFTDKGAIKINSGFFINYKLRNEINSKINYTCSFEIYKNIFGYYITSFGSCKK